MSKNPIFDRIVAINKVAHEFAGMSPKMQRQAALMSDKRINALKSVNCPKWMKKELGPDWEYFMYSPSVIKKAPFLIEGN